MTRTYSIWIVSPPGLIWSHVFDDVAVALQSGFRELGHDVAVVTDPKEIRGTALVLGANLLPLYKMALPDDSIIFNLEQAHPDSRWFKPDYGYTDLLKIHPVWDFSHRNIALLNQMGIEGVIYCGIGYAPELTKTPRKKSNIDVLFIGGKHPRREKVLEGITERGARTHQLYLVFGKERDEWMARGKIHINIHKEPATLFEIVRVSYLLANRCFIVSESGSDAEMEKRFSGGLVFCKYDKLVDTCLDYLVRPKERKQIAEAGFDIIRQMPQWEFLATALEVHNRMYPEKKVAKPPARPRIFVTMASHRDPECQPTLEDLFAKAAFPERIHVGVCLQVDPETDTDCLIDKRRLPGQVDILQVHHKDSQGANWARVEAFRFMQGEEYTLMIDSHMRFEPGWDETLIDMLKRCPAEKPVISGYIPNYEPPDERHYVKDNLLRMRIRKLGEEIDPQLIHVTGVFIPVKEERGGLYPTPFCIANFTFTRSSTFTDVPIDPHIHFWGDEITYAARLWTLGYDIFQPDKVVLFHYWVRKDRFHLHDYRHPATPKNQRSRDRVIQLLGLGQSRGTSPLLDIDRYKLGTERLLVDFWEFIGVDLEKHEFTKDAGEGRWNMVARENALKKGTQKKSAAANAVTTDAPLPRIFVQIASYRDPDCQNTVKDLFEKAAHPERISVGICWQFVKEEDEICFKEPYPYPDQVRVHEVDARQGQGVCWARGLTQKLWQGEEFTFQIDSHMRFEQGWDDLLLSLWQECGGGKAVLTCYPPGFTPPDQFEKDWIFGMSAKEFDKHNIFLMKGAPAWNVAKGLPQKPVLGAFASANMLFGPSSLIQDVPYDPYLYFFGEEITLAVRLWTSGYDLYHPNKRVVYHDWNRSKRKTHFSDHKDWPKLDQRAIKRVCHLLGTALTAEADSLEELDKYGLGSARTLQEYQEFSGVDFTKKTINEKGAQCKFTPYSAKGTKTKAPAAIQNSGGTQPKIFVNIASYRDPECQWTVKDLFEKATHPDRINVGICWQFDQKEDQHCFEVTTRPKQVRITPVDWREAEGVCWARLQTQQLWEGEDYTLMIDSHMRFVPGWDELMIQELAACESNKPVLSCSPTRYFPPDKLDKNMNPTIRRVKPFFPDGNIRCQGEMLDRSPPKPLRGAFLVANFIFSRSDITPEVPYDPYLYFDQEEITYALRLYTHGWDIFSSRQQFLYHYYNDQNVPGGSVRPLHWSDLRKEDEPRIRFLRDRGLKRFNHLTRFRLSTDPEVIKELDVYGFGRERTLEEYEAWSGVDFKRKVATERALRCQFIEDLHKYRDRPIRIPEIDDKKPGAPPVGQPVNAPAQGGNVVAFSPPGQSSITVTALPKTLPGPPKMLEVGDFLPLFEVPDTNKKMKSMESAGGRHGIFVYLSAHHGDYAQRFFDAIKAKVDPVKNADLWMIFVMDDRVEKLDQFRQQHNVPYALCADPERKIARSLGLCRIGEVPPPVGYVLDQRLKMTHRHVEPDPLKMAEMVYNDYTAELERYRQQQSSARVITEIPPVLIVPNALSPELCARCISAFNKGHSFEGTVGAAEKKMYRADIKVRRDYIMNGTLLAEVDEKLSRSFFPEIKRVFGFEVTHREPYKVGLYTGEKGGFFKQHRDNFDAPLGYRRVAATIHLNAEYEGGGLRFPEYDENIYRPESGSGIAFSCATLHEARKVTAGNRFILVAFLHGKEDEAYRHYFHRSRNEPVKADEFVPTVRRFPELKESRHFYDAWQDKHVRYEAQDKPQAAAQPQQAVASGLTAVQLTPPTQGASAIIPVTAPKLVTPNVMINTLGKHQPRKVYESKSGIIYDDFLPPDIYKKIHDYGLTTDYEYINTKGKLSRAWHVHDGFPLRSSSTQFYHAVGLDKQKADYVYPTKTEVDLFIESMLAIQPQVEHITGKETIDWEHFSVSVWLYPHGTGLALHDDGSGVYTGAYVFFMNDEWRAHWGGLLLLLEEEANAMIHDFRKKGDQFDFYKRKFLHANPLDEMVLEHGFAKCVFPKGNRMVFIANEAYHMVTRVNEQSGDNLRMSLAGFFNRYKPNKK